MDNKDALMQLFNRGALDKDIAAALVTARAGNEPLSVVMVDVDHFKKVNDTHGHQAGDSVLKEVAARLMQVCRTKGTAYRYGGEEIVLLLPNHGSNEALSVAERARLSLEMSPVGNIQVTASFGVSSFPQHGTDAAILLGAADAAMYDAKNRGRNIVCLHGEPAPAEAVARTPDRKPAEPGRWTDSVKSEMRRRLLRLERIECPDDGAYLEVHDATYIGSVGREFMVICPDCGAQERLSGSQR